MLAMALTQEPFTDKKVREAFSYAIDRETLCAEMLAGTAPRRCPSSHLGFQDRSKPTSTRFDPEGAEQALAESSYGGPENLPEIKLFYNSDFEDRAQASEWIAGEIRDILGVELSSSQLTARPYALRKEPETYPQLLYFGSWYQDYPDPRTG